MPLNLIKKYPQLLELSAFNPHDREKSLYGVFNRDIVNNDSFKFRNKQINPTPLDGEIKMSILFTHLTTVMVDNKTNNREFEMHRSVRLHWVKYHIDEIKDDKLLTFSIKEPNGFRTYIYDITEKYVVILEPLRNKSEYYLLSAFHVRGKDAARNKFRKKYNRKLNEVL